MKSRWWDGIARICPRTLRARLILVLTLAMVLTQVAVVIAATEIIVRMQRDERVAQFARVIALIKPQILLSLDHLPEEVALSPRSVLSLPVALAASTPAATPLSTIKDSAGLQHERSSSEDSITLRVTRKPPVASGEDDATLRALQASEPSASFARYTDLSSWPGAELWRPYKLEVWTKLDADRFLYIALDESNFAYSIDAQRSIFPVVDVLLRFAVALLLATLIAGWVINPLATMAKEADEMFPDAPGSLAPSNDTQHAWSTPAEIKVTQAAFVRMRSRIDALVNERTSMLTALAHDLRTPLTRLMLRLELTNDLRLAREARVDCERMQVLISRTLEYLRSAEVRANEGASTLESVSLKNVLDATLATLTEPEAMRVRIHGDDATIPANSWGLERIFANLIENALKYSPATTPVHVFIETTSAYVRVRVVDEGPGVPLAAIERLREPFYRVDEARGIDDGGVGLGLSIVDNLTRAYNGQLMFQNRLPTGLEAVVIWDQTSSS